MVDTTSCLGHFFLGLDIGVFVVCSICVRLIPCSHLGDGDFRSGEGDGDKMQSL